MTFFNLIKNKGLEQLVFCHDESVGLRAIIAVHNTLLGPALAPVRMIDYPDEEAAVTDAVNLARNMTYRAAIADCDIGGASAVLWADPAMSKTEAYFRSFGRFLERFGGQLYVVMGVGTEGADIHNIKRETDKVLAQGTIHGGLADPTELTADGIFQGLRATVRDLTGKADFNGASCLIQGLGRIGTALTTRLHDAGATLIVTDLNYDRIKVVQDKFPDVTMVRPEEAFDVRCDIIVPCSPACQLEVEAFERLKCRAIAGASSFIVNSLEAADALHERGISFMPHFVVDSGEVIQADFERKGVPATRLPAAIDGIYRRARSIQEEAKEAGESPLRTALRKAQSRLTSIGNIGRRNAW